MTRIAQLKRFLWRHCATDWQRAHHYLRRIDRLYSRLIAEAESRKDRVETENLYGMWQAEREPEAHEVRRLQTIHYRKKASRYYIPDPDDDPKYWERNEYLGGVHLTVAGIDFIESRFYEKRQRRWGFWFSAGSLLIGLIGALIGLVAMLTDSN